MIVTYECELCHKKFDNAEACLACENRGIEPAKAKVGDFVTTDGWKEDYGRFGWYDGDPSWVIPKTDGLHSTPNFPYCSLIYIVTAVDNDGHRARYHLETKGMTNNGYRGGWTTYPGGRDIYPLPTELTKDLDGSDLIGRVWRRDYLL